MIKHKVIYGHDYDVLFRQMLDHTTQGTQYETLQRVNATQYKTKLECLIELNQASAQHKDVKGVGNKPRMQFFCGDETRYFNKGQTLY